MQSAIPRGGAILQSQVFPDGTDAAQGGKLKKPAFLIEGNPWLDFSK